MSPAPDPSREPLLKAYEDLVRAWAPKLDLIAPGDLGRFRSRHIDDSLTALEALEGLPPGPCIDVGSGAGLPGIPLAICGPESFSWRLLEPRQRRAAFLEEVVRELDLACEVIVATAEQAASDPALGESHVFAVARALADPIEAFRLLRPLVAPGGRAAVFLGERGEVPQGTEGRRGGLAIMNRVLDV